MKRVTILLLALVGAVVVTGGAAAIVHDSTVSVDRPDTTTIETDVVFASNTNATAELVRDGEVLDSQTVSGSASSVATITLDTTGLQTGDYNLQVSSPDESNVTFGQTRHITTVDVGSTSINDTVTTDVEFEYDSSANATVELIDSDTSSTLQTTELNFSAVEASGGTSIETAEFVTDVNTTNSTVQITTNPAEAYSQSWVQDEPTNGLFAGLETSSETSRVLLVSIGFIAILFLGTRFSHE